MGPNTISCPGRPARPRGGSALSGTILAALVLFGALPGGKAQEEVPLPAPPKARSPLPSRKARSKARELLVLLGKIREARQRIRKKAGAFREEKKALEEEIQALRSRIRKERAEKARLEKERLQARQRAQEAEERAKAREIELRKASLAGKKARDALETLLSGRDGKGTPLSPPPARPEDLAPWFRKFFLRLEVEAGKARSVEARRIRLEEGGRVFYLDLLRLGRVALLWRTLDGRKAGWVDRTTGERRPFPPAQAPFFSREIGKALEILDRKAPPELCLLPFPQVPPEVKEKKR